MPPGRLDVVFVAIKNDLSTSVNGLAARMLAIATRCVRVIRVPKRIVVVPGWQPLAVVPELPLQTPVAVDTEDVEVSVTARCQRWLAGKLTAFCIPSVVRWFPLKMYD